MNEDLQHLKLLAVFHYIVAGITALFSCVFIVHVAMGIAMLTGAFDAKDAPPPVLAWFFIVFPGALMLCGWALSACIVMAGRRLARQRSRLFCIVVAGLECMLMPFGTVLGVLTIIVLMRESVKPLFAPRNATPAQP